MAEFRVDLAEDLAGWLDERAAERGFTRSQMLEHLIGLESGLRDLDPLGRRIPLRDVTYRQMTLPANGA